MQYVIDLTTKPNGYKQALITFFGNADVTGFYLEYGYPQFGDCKSPEARFERLYQLDESRVCAVATHFVIFEDKAILEVLPCGPYKDYVANLDLFAPAARMLTTQTLGITHSLKVDQICSFDLIPKLDHIDYQPSET